MPTNKIGIITPEDLSIGIGSSHFTPDGLVSREFNGDSQMDGLELVNIGGRSCSKSFQTVLRSISLIKHKNGLEALAVYIDELVSGATKSETNMEIDEICNKLSAALGFDKERTAQVMQQFLILELGRSLIPDINPITIEAIEAMPRSIDAASYYPYSKGKDTSSQTWKRHGKNVKSYNR